MKSIFNYKTTLWFLVGFFLYSCQIKESMKINEDGSGSINYSLDMGAFMSTISKTKKNTDSTGTVAKESSKKVIDTVMYFNKMLENMPADSVAKLTNEQKEAIKSLEKFLFRAQIDEKNSKCMIGIEMNFKNTSEIAHLPESMSKSSGLFNKKNAMAKSTQTGSSHIGKGTKISYEYSKKKFSRIEKVSDKAEFELGQKELKEQAMFYNGSMFTIEYTFPQKIKKVNVTGAELSNDGKTVTYKIPYLDYMKDPEKYALEIKF